MTPPLTPAELAALRLAASEATPGPWCVWCNEGPDHRGVEKYSICQHEPLKPDGSPDYCGTDEKHQCVATAHACKTDKQNAANAAHIALANPAVVLALLDALAARDAEVARLERHIVDLEALGIRGMLDSAPGGRELRERATASVADEVLRRENAAMRATITQVRMAVCVASQTPSMAESCLRDIDAAIGGGE